MSVYRTCTVSFLKSVAVVTLDSTTETVTLAGAADINNVALSEYVCLYDVANVDS